MGSVNVDGSLPEAYLDRLQDQVQEVFLVEVRPEMTVKLGELGITPDTTLTYEHVMEAFEAGAVLTGVALLLDQDESHHRKFLPRGGTE